MIRDIDLNLLTVFDAVMAERNLRKAGERLGRSQPSVSQAVARLRDLTGDQLFERAPSGITPTARAEVLWSEIRDPLAELRKALLPSHFDPSEVVGETVFGLSDDARILFWPELARTLLQKAPGSSLRSVDTNHSSVWRDLDQGVMDLALTVAGQPPPGFGARILHQDEFVLLISPGAAPPQTPSDYAGLRHLALVFSEEQPAYADEALQALDMQRRVVARSSRFDTLPQLVRELDAVVALPRLIAGYFAAHHDVALCPLPVPFPPAILKLCWHEKKRNNTHHKWLREVAVRHVRDQIEALSPENNKDL
ncbi:MAG: LysR substrate-binding domain-containing protein [Pseudomonadota bacterium]